MARLLRGVVCTILLATAILGRTAVANVGVQADRPIVILIAIDGWRWDYLDRFAPPAITRLARAGVVAEGLIPIFPSKTFPNHYTIVTGLRAARHGITSNNIEDPHLPRRFTLSDRDVQQDTRWWGGEPIWVTAERQGQIAATMFWPGSDVEIAGDRPTFYKAYDHDFPLDARVDQVLGWLDRPEPQRPTFATLYFSNVDDAGHDYGPDAAETRQAALLVDRAIGRLVAGVERLGLAGRSNYVLVSDHGMAALSRDRVIVLDQYLDLALVDILDSAPVVGLSARSGVSVETVYAALAGRHPALQVYTRELLPEQHRLRGHPRLPDVIGIADEGWHPTTREWLARPDFPGGNHGFEPRHRSMHGLFIATGPRFKSGVAVPAFENLHIYELLCRILKLRPASNDGDPLVTASFTR